LPGSLAGRKDRRRTALSTGADLVALDFSTDLENLAADFTGREWLLEEVDAWLKSPAERFFILTGEPGIGKSAIVANWVRCRSDIAAYHLCIAGRNETIVPSTVLRSLAAQLGKNLPGYGIALANSIKPTHLTVNVDVHVASMTGGQITGLYIKHLSVLDPQTEAEVLLRAPLAALPAPRQPLIVLIDSLDEAATLRSDPTLVGLLSGMEGLPAWLRILCTSRPEERVLSCFNRLQPRILAAESRTNREDVRRYVTARVSRSAFKEKLAAAGHSEHAVVALIAGAHDSSEPGLAAGNFLYVKMLLSDIERGIQPLDRLAVLPKSLDDIYRRFLQRLAPDWETRYQPLLAVLCVAREPLTREQLTRFGDHSARMIGGRMTATLVNTALGVLVQFLDVRGTPGDERYALFHQSLRDYLGDPGRSGRFACPPADGHGAVVGHLFSGAASDGGSCDDYGLRHLPLHLAEAGQYERLHALLTDFNWLQAKLNAAPIDALVRDYDVWEGGRKKPLSLEYVQTALRRSAHALARDKNQLAAHLIGRLSRCEDGEIQQLLRHAADYRGSAWLRPLTASLAQERSVRSLGPARGEALDHVVFSANGRFAGHVSFDADPPKVVLWDLGQWRSLGPRFQTLAQSNPFALALSNDGRWCFYADSIGGVHRLDAMGGPAWEGHAHRDLAIASVLAISSDGQRALSACGHGRLVAWDIGTGQEEILYDESSNGIEALSLDAAGESSGVARRDGSIDLLELWPTRRRTLFKFEGRPAKLTRTSDNLLIAVALRDGRIEVRLIASADRPLLAFSVQEEPTAIALSEDHRYIAVGTIKGNMEVWDIERGERSAIYARAHAHKVECVVFNSDSDRVVTADIVNVKEWAVEATEDEKQGGDEYATGLVKVTADGLQAAAVLADGRLGMWNLSTGELQATFPHPPGLGFNDPGIGPPKGLTLAASAPRALSWNDNLLCLWDLKADAIARSLPAREIRAADIALDGNDVVFVTGGDVSRWRPDEGRVDVLGTYDGDPPRCVVISPDGRRALSCGGDRRVFEWRLDAGGRRSPLHPTAPQPRWQNSWWPDAPDKPAALAFAGPQEAVVATGDGSVFAIHMQRKNPDKFSGPPGRASFNSVLVTEEGEFTVASSDQKIVIWQVSTRRCIAVFDAHPGRVEQASGSGQRALLLTRDGVLKVVSLRDGSLLAAFQADAPITACAANADLRWISACDQRGMMHFFHVEPRS
jgi:WD40 repeat protein